MGHFDNKVVVVTGSGGGLGRCHALAFAREGASVVVNDLGGARDGTGSDASVADKVAREIRDAGGRAAANHDSVSTKEGADAIVATALKEFGRIDILVNNAGILRDKTILKMPEEMWDAVIAVHLKGTFLCTQAAARAMVEQKQGGRIINTSSFAGLKGNFGQANYGAAKAGIYAVTLISSMELAKHRITVNSIAPLAKTRMTDDVSMIPDDMKPEMVSPMVLFLASDKAAGITGRTFGIHGGQLFEYKMTSTEGLSKAEPWTIESIDAAMGQIEGSAAPAPAAAPAAAASAPAPAPVAPEAPAD
ncbi:MAG: SDR family NAD(P)-dependent oxidoreductase, partial [Pseudomonadota bacterium]